MSFFITFIDILVQVLIFAIFIRAILSWFPISRENPLVLVVYQVTEPVLAPLRRVVPSIGFIDITPIVALLLLQLIQFAIHSM